MLKLAYFIEKVLARDWSLNTRFIVTAMSPARYLCIALHKRSSRVLMEE